MILTKNTRIHKWQAQHLKSTKRWQILVWHRKARKTYTSIIKVFQEAIKHPDIYWIIEPTYKLAKTTLWDDPRMLFDVIDNEVIKHKNKSDLSLELINGAWIYLYGADHPDYLRGPNPKGVVLDEYSVEKEQIWTEVVAPVLYMNHGWAWFLFTPKGKNHAYQLYQRAKNSEDWETSYLPVSVSHLLSAREIKSIRETSTSQTFEQEFECKFLEGEGTVFRKVEGAVEGVLLPPDPQCEYIFGIDLGRKQDYTVISGFNRMTNHLDYFDRFTTVDWPLQVKRIKEAAKRYNDALCVVEANSIGDPIIRDLRDQGIRVLPFQTTSSSKRDIIEKLSIFIENKYITYPNIPVFLDELQSFGYTISGNKTIKYGAPEGLHDDTVMATAIAVTQLKDTPRSRPTITPSIQLDQEVQNPHLDPYN